MRSEQDSPQLSNRYDRDKWLAVGASDAHARASKKVKQILSEPRKSYLPEKTRKRLLKDIPGIQPFIMQ